MTHSALTIPKLIVRQNYKTRVSKNDLCIHSFQTYDSLLAEGFRPRKDIEPWRFSLPIDWAVNPFNDRNWQFQLNGWRLLEPMVEKYFATNDAVYLLEAINIAHDWQQFNESGADNAFTWHDMAAGLRALRLALFLDRIFSGQIEVSREVLESLMICAGEHIARLRDESFISKGNHGVFQVFGLNLLASVALGPVAYRTCQEYCARMFRRILEHGYTAEGVHKEHSPSYHLFTTDRIQRMRPERIGDAAATSLLNRANEIGGWLVRPDHYVAPLGDSSGKGKRLKGPVGLTTLGSGRSFAVADFTKSGYAVVRTDPDKEYQPSMLTVAGAWYSNAHKHSDELSFTLFEHGEPVFIDSGKYGYQYDQWREYVVSAAAHNTISFRDPAKPVGQPEKKGSFLLGLKTEEDAFVIEGSVTRKGTFTHNRRIAYSPERYLHICDEIQMPGEEDCASSLHFSNHLKPVLLANGFEVELDCGKLIRGTVSGGICDLELSRGLSEPLLGWQSVDYLALKEATVVRAIGSGTHSTIKWRIDLA